MNPQNKFKHIVISFGTALLLAVGLFLTISLLPTRPALADGSIIYVNAGAGGSDDGTSWDDAYTHLQDALDQANANGSTDYEIWVAAGVYYPDEDSDGNHTAGRESEYFTLGYNNVQLYGGFAATETLRTERDWETNLTILSGDIDGNDTTDANGVVTSTANISGDNANHVLYLDGATNEAIDEATVIDGFTVTAGQADGSYPHNCGGGLYCAGSGSGHECSPALANVTFSGNSAKQAGGGMYNDGENFGKSSPMLSNVTFSSNSARYGGGMYNDGGWMYYYNNYYGVSSPILTNVTFSGNSAGDNGGGMVNDGNNSGVSSPTLTNVTFSGNSAGDNGGGMYNYNYDDSYGDYYGKSSPTLANVTFSGNSAGDSGGGMYNYGDFYGECSPSLTNVTFSGNSAGNYGGGMYNYGFVYYVSSPVLINVILWGNTAGSDGSQVHNDTARPDFIYSLVQGSGGSDGWDSSLGYDAGGNLDTDPLFTNAGGEDDTPGTADDDLSLQAASPAIDAGNNTVLPADTHDLDGDGDTAETIPVDLAGNPRRVDTSVTDTGNGTAPLVDMGAYEGVNQIYLPLVLRTDEG